MRSFAWLRRVLCFVMAFAVLLCSFGPIKVRADAATAVLKEAGTLVGVNPYYAIACILIALGIGVGLSNEDFWTLVEEIATTVGPELLGIHEVGYNNEELMEAFYYENVYYFSETSIKSVNDYLYRDTVTYDSTTETLKRTAVVQHDFSFTEDTTKESSLDKGLAWLYNNYYDEWVFADSASMCTVLYYSDSTYRFIFSNDAVTYSPDAEGNYSYRYPTGEYVCLHVNSDGTFYTTTDAYGVGVSHMTEGLYYYKTAHDLTLSNTSQDIDEIISVNFGVGFEDNSSGGGSGDNEIDWIYAMYGAIKLQEIEDRIEQMTQEEAQSGVGSTPDIVVDLDTEEVIEANGDTGYASFGEHVSVDAETAIASILISLGISPGSSNADFRQLIADIITVLPAEYYFAFDSAAYGSKTMLNAWLYDDTYYFSQDIMEFVNDYIWGNTEYSESIFVHGTDFDVDSSRFYGYYGVSQALLNNSNFASIAENLESLLVYYFSYDCSYHYVFSTSSIDFTYIESSTCPIKTSGGYVEYQILNDSISVVRSNLNTSGNYLTVISLRTKYVSDYCLYELSVSSSLDLTLFNYSSLLSDLSFDVMTVTEDGTDLTYYPVKLFPTLDETESATQTEIQTDYESSVPSITVDPDDRVIIEVNIPTIQEGDTDPDPTTDTDTDTNTDPTTDSDVDPDPTIDSGSDTGGSSGSDADVETGTGAITEDGLWSVLQRFGKFLLNLFWTPFKWLGNMLLEGVWPFFEWLGSVLLQGIQTVAEWLSDSLLTGLETLFVPKEDFLTEKVDALCTEFAFAGSIIETANLIGDALAGIGTEPPVIYIDLGAAEGSYYYGEEVPFIDMRWYAAYKPTADLLLSALLWICFCWRVFVKLPGIISGASGTFNHIAQQEGKISRD